MTRLRVRMDDLLEYIQHVGVQPPQYGRVEMDEGEVVVVTELSTQVLFFPFPPFIKTVGIMFGLSAGEELYRFLGKFIAL